MDYNDTLNDFLGSPIRSLEIDRSCPDFTLEDYQLGHFQTEGRSLDISFGGRKVVIDVKQERWDK